MMPSPFAITVVPTSLTVEAGKVGQFEVTVSNRAGQPLTARANRVVEPKTAQDWLQPRDKEEAPLAPGATQTFVFDVKVPAGSAAQTVKARVDFSDVTDPDRFFAQGQTVAVTVTVPTPPPNGKPKWWIYAVAALVVAVVGFGVYTLVRPKKPTTVPDVVHMTAGAAQARLDSFHLKIQQRDTFTTDTGGFRAGVVVRQSPEAGQARPKDSTVQVAVQKQWSVVPQIAPPTPLMQAVTILAAAGLQTNAQPLFNSNIFLMWRVQGIAPGAGTVVPRKSAVTVTFYTMASSCPDLACVPPAMRAAILQSNARVAGPFLERPNVHVQPMTP